MKVYKKANESMVDFKANTQTILWNMTGVWKSENA